MKKTTLLLCSAFLLSAVGCTQQKGIIPENVTELQFASSDGEVSWAPVGNATEYGYTVDGKEVFKTTETSINIFDVVKNPGATSLEVWSINGENISEKATLSFKSEKLATPKKAVVASDPATNDYLLTWEEVPNASKYLVSVNDGKFVTYHTNSFKPSAKGNYSLKVSCKQYVKDKATVYLASDVSEKSETLSYLPGPTLRQEKMNEITWSSEDPNAFDSYNLWVDGKKVRENVTSPLNLVTGENPVLTKTGEYDIQIEAVKGAFSYWSNVHEDFGTSNINPGEFYSFDNRIFNKNIPSGVDAGWAISNKQSHSAPNSMYVPTQVQVNAEKYVHDGINDVDYRKVNKMSYWVYIPKIEGYSGKVKGVNLPPIVFDGWGADAVHDRLISFPKESQQELPYNEWVELHYEVENQYENVVIFGAGAPITLDDGVTEMTVPFYLDDIGYSEVDPVQYDYKFKYDVNLCGGAWSNKPQKLSFGKEFASKEVEIKMDVCGTAAPTGTHLLGFGSFDKDKNLTGLHTELDRSKISTLDYQTISFNAKLDENGDFYTALFEKDASDTDSETVIVYAKNVTCAPNKYAAGTMVESSLNANNTYVSILALPVNEEAGTTMEVEMDVAVRASTEWSSLKSATDTWATPTPTPRDFDVLANAELRQSDDWRKIKFSTKVLNAPALNFHDGNTGHSHAFTGNYVLLYFFGHTETDAFYYKPETVKMTAVSSLVPSGDNGQAGIYYQSVTGLKSDLAVGTPVSVTMDVLMTGAFDEWSQIQWVDRVWTAEGGELDADHTRITNLFSTGSSAWQTITFDAVIRNFPVLRVGVDYPKADTSAYGNAVYLVSMNKSADSFSYKNVAIVAK